ncbi:MAG TPA: serine/threonine-protein kinase [Solirubrobacterales bacterium]|nr:serine/threonine-protein kinase [Solirubrobacterales bacterium]
MLRTTIENAETKWRLAEGDEIVPGRHALRRLGGGSRYEAYLAFDDHLHAIVVAKVVRPHLIDDAHTLAGLAAEAEMLARLDHPVILRRFDAELGASRPHLVLEHLEGPRLSTLIRRHGPLPVEQLVPLAIQIGSALQYVAAEGIVHLDVKPANIIMSAPPRLIDLSVALDVDEAARLAHPVGTDSYMAPEQCDPLGRGPVGTPADVWGLGATLHRALTGDRPFGEGEPSAPEPALRWPQLVRGPERIGGRMHPSVVEAIAACLAPAPPERPSAREVVEALEAVLDDQPRPRLAPLKPRWR